MKLQRLGRWALPVATTVALLVSAGTFPASAEDSVYIPQPSYRTGPYSVNGTPFANGFSDYLHMLNARDGGIEGVKIETEECEFGYKTDKGVECYERLKAGNPVAYSPLSTGVTYKLVPKARVDQIPLLSMGYGMSAAADGRWFPYVFNFPTSYWSQASAFIRFIGEQEGGIDKLAGKKIGLIYLESGYGREPIPLFEALGEKYGYSFTSYSVPGKEMQKQQAQWRKIDRDGLDWLFMWGWGVMNRTAIQRATEVGYPLDRFIGVWWSGADSDTQPLGELAKGYRAGTFHATGQCCQVHKDIIANLYDQGEGTDKDSVGQVLYNRGALNAMFITEAVRDAIKTHGPKVTGVEVRDAMENLDLNVDRLKGLGFDGFTGPVKITCADHENNGPVMMQEWDGASWSVVETGIEPLVDVVRPMLEAAAVTEAEKFGYTMRENCT
jgi:branched-chain amino acid transport system substrate-binding protein